VSGGNSKAPLPGRIVGYALVVVVVAWSARTVWELLMPLVPVLSGVVVLAGLLWLLARLRR